MKDGKIDLEQGEVWLVDKPAGITSFGVVAQVRRRLADQAEMVEVVKKDGVVRQKRKKVKVGHAGTLDPFATGLLLVLVGKATKRATEFLKLDKEYIATVRFGAVSSTGDLEGEITAFSDEVTLSESSSPMESCDSDPCQPKESSSIPSKTVISPSITPVLEIPSREEVGEVVRRFMGEIEQTVPRYSAVSINGQRAYKLARAGRVVEMPRRKVKIYELEILRYEWPELEIRCKVSSGTYIRALGEDIGKALGVGGYLTALRRTQVGEYRIEQAKKLEELV